MNDVHAVLRTIYLDYETDEKLRYLAFDNNMTKGDLMKKMITVGLGKLNEMQADDKLQYAAMFDQFIMNIKKAAVVNDNVKLYDAVSQLVVGSALDSRLLDYVLSISKT